MWYNYNQNVIIMKNVTIPHPRVAYARDTVVDVFVCVST